MKTDISSMSLSELEEYIVSIGEMKYRAEQIFKWVSKGRMSFDEMSGLNKQLISKLNENCIIASLEQVKKLTDRDGTVKYLFRLHDGLLIETVVMQYKHGRSICISSQAGCLMGCRFCASTLRGKQRDLTAGEMLMQVAYANRENKISNVVVMGVGEPLDNYDNLLKFLYNLKDEKGLNISHRHVSVSTCGIVPKIKALAKEKLQITLSVSLHAPDNLTRDMIMPVNRKWHVEELIEACKEYMDITHRRISFEYTLIDGVNDTDAHAFRLSELLRGMMCHVNLIPVNKVEERDFRPSGREKIERFERILKNRNINVTVRRKLGGEINASCGQLRYNGG